MKKVEELYIDLLKKSLIDYVDLENNGPHDKIEGKDLWPSDSTKTMIGLKALNNIEYCINDIINDNIQGDFLEAGVWKGGATIFMKALSDIFNMNRIVWVADSFEGLPKPDIKYPLDENSPFHTMDKLKISIEEVKNNFIKYNLLDYNVRFLKGFFEYTLNTPEIKKLSLLRLDGDMYSSTIQTLEYLYPKLEVGGYIIIDDYNTRIESKTAVNDYRKDHNINEKITEVNWACVYWKKER